MATTNDTGNTPENESSFANLDLTGKLIINDYNQALTLAQDPTRIDEAIELLESHMSVLSESIGLFDERVLIKVILLLAILYLEQRRDASKALSLLQFITDKFDATCQPARLPQLKAKCYLQMNATKAAKRELKSISGEPLIRTYLELQRNNLKKATKIFSGCTDETSMYHNNEALLQYKLGKRCTAVYHLTKAMTSGTSDILYNLACVHLFTGNRQSAFNILLHLLREHKNNPRIWLRLAECRLEDCQTALDDLDLMRSKDLNVQNQLLEKMQKRLLMMRALAGNDSRKSINTDDLKFARGCLLNALTLLNSSTPSFFPSPAPSETDLNKLKISVLLCLAHANQQLGEYSAALTFSNTALKLNPQDYQKMLANTYAGEALIGLKQLGEAVPYFSVNHAQFEQPTGDDSVQLPPHITSWFPNTAKITLLYNLAVTFALKNEFEKAEETLRTLKANMPSGFVMPAQVTGLTMYIALKQGSVEMAKSILRQQMINS